MSDCFITRRGFNKTKSNGNILTLFKDGEMINGLSSFKYLNTPTDSGIIKYHVGDSHMVNGLKVNLTGSMAIYKSNPYNSYNPDSIIISTNEKIDLTNYNYIMFSFLSGNNYSSSFNLNNYGGGYFRIDEPENLPVNNTAYDWDSQGWDTVFTQNLVTNVFVKDISNVKGQHYLCFGLCHGQYTGGYTSYFAFNNLFLI